VNFFVVLGAAMLTIFIFLPAYLLLLLLGRAVRPWRITIGMTVLSGALVFCGYVSSRPSAIFKRMVMPPETAGLSNLRMRCSAGVDGCMWVFVFKTDQHGFDVIRRKLDLEAPPDWPQRQQEIMQAMRESQTQSAIASLVDSLIDDSLFRCIYRTDYARPSRPEYYRGGKMRAIRDPDTGQVFLLIDDMIPPHDRK
jgi:hypothetical protein